MADVAVKSLEYRMVTVNAPVLRRSVFRCLGPYLTGSKQVVLMGDWNAIFDPKIDKVR